MTSYPPSLMSAAGVIVMSRCLIVLHVCSASSTPGLTTGKLSLSDTEFYLLIAVI